MEEVKIKDYSKYPLKKLWILVANKIDNNNKYILTGFEMYSSESFNKAKNMSRIELVNFLDDK